MIKDAVDGVMVRIKSPVSSAIMVAYFATKWDAVLWAFSGDTVTTRIDEIYKILIRDDWCMFIWLLVGYLVISLFGSYAYDWVRLKLSASNARLFSMLQLSNEDLIKLTQLNINTLKAVVNQLKSMPDKNAQEYRNLGPREKTVVDSYFGKRSFRGSMADIENRLEITKKAHSDAQEFNQKKKDA